MKALDRAIARPHPVREFGARSPLHGLDRRSVGFLDVLAQSVSAVAPAAAATTMIMLVAGAAGAATIPAVAVATALAVLTASTINQFAKRMAAAGSLYTFVSKGLGARPSLVAASAILVGYAFVSIFALLGSAHYLMILGGRVWPGFDHPLALAALLLILGGALALVLVRGIRLSTRIALIVETVSVTIIVALFTILLIRVGPLDWGALLPTQGISPSGIAAGTALALTAFVGFESSAALGVEARSPLRAVPRAIMATVLVAGVLYILAAVAQVAGSAATGEDLAASGASVNALAQAFGLDALAVIADLGVAASFLACAVASTTALTRVLFSLGREGVAPRMLGRTHPRFRTPIGAIAVGVPAVAAIPILIAVAGRDLWSAMEATIVVAAAGYIVAYVLVCVAAPVFLRRIGELTTRSAVTAIVAAVGLAASLVAYLVGEAQAGNPGVWVTAALAAGGLVALAVSGRWRRGVSAAIGAYDEPLASDVLGGIATGAPWPGDDRAAR